MSGIKASKSSPCGTLSSNTMMVMMMAMTPSLNASSLPELITACRSLIWNLPKVGYASGTMLKPYGTLLAAIGIGSLHLAGAWAAAPLPPGADQQLARDMLKTLIELNTTHAHGSTEAARAIQAWALTAGFAPGDVVLIAPPDRPAKGNLIVRYRGKHPGKPVLFLGHLDVVEAKREDWSVDPFEFTEKDGYYYGRGTFDMKDGDAALAESLIRLKRERFVPERDIIVAFTADEEAGTSNGVDWLIKNHRELIDAEFVLNHDGGGILTDHGKPVMMTVDATEKLYADYQL